MRHLARTARSLRYCAGRCLHAAMTRQEEVNTEVTSPLRCLGYLSGLLLVVALGLGLYVRWESTAEPALLLLLLLPALGVLVVAALSPRCPRGAERLGLQLLHLWLGFLLGLLCFLGGRDPRADPRERASGLLLVFSAVLRTLWALLERLLGAAAAAAAFRPAFLTSAERAELAGFAAAAAALLPPRSSCSAVVLVVALGTAMAALRMRAALAVPSLAGFAVVTGALFFDALHVRCNPFALACFFVQLICDPLLDFFCSGLSVMERWQPFLQGRGLWRRGALLPVVLLEAAFVALAARRLAHPEPWYLVVPAFVLCGIFWSVCHVVFFITAWGFHSKLSECQRVSLSQGAAFNRLDKIMASKGMRHFCLISKKLLLLTLISTGAMAALCWQASSSIFLSMFLLVIPLESLFHGLFHELGDTLGGTCVGYAVVVPTNYCSPDGQPMLLPPHQVQELNQRSTGMLSSVQRFFAHHLIEAFGCDYSTSGVTLEALQAKIKSFLELCTADGPRHDTYVIFYSGHTHRSGEWALAGGDTLRLNQIVDWWKEKNSSFSSRLILVLDCDNSLPWVEEIRRVEGPYVAVQGATLGRATDVEHQDPPQLGDFTSQWVEYNCNPNSGIQWSEQGRAVAACYGVSKHWSDFTLHLPTGSDVTNHFPRAAYPVVQMVLSWSSSSLSLGCTCWRFLKRLKLNRFPPTILDTGQGFKLVRS